MAWSFMDGKAPVLSDPSWLVKGCGLKKHPSSHQRKEFFRAYPKVELHRHLEGSLRLGTLWEVARDHDMVIPTTGRLRSLVQVNEEEPYTFENFLSKFETLRLFYRSPEIIGRVTREAITDAANDAVRYMELRFTPVALSKAQGYPLTEVMDWVIEGANAAMQENPIVVRLIASVNRNESVTLAEQVAQLAVERREKGIVALDLAGNEAHFSALPFMGVFREAQKAGLHVTVHAGEWGGASNVSDAILSLKAERIGHGVRVMEDARVVSLAREHQPAFEVCVTSNYQSGVVPVLSEHPLMRMLAAGLNVTLNTDDPSISQINLTDEYCTAFEDLKMPLDTLKTRVLAAAHASFLKDAERQALVQSLENELKGITEASSIRIAS
jgi:adenosine deaminase